MRWCGRWNKNSAANFPTTKSPTRCIKAGQKFKGISTAEVRERQLAQLQPDELQMLRQVSASAQPKPTTPDPDCESNALAFAVAHVFERRSVVPEYELMNVALSQRSGEVDLPRLKTAVNQSPASSRSLPAVSQEQFYVSISRGRDTCRVFTDDVMTPRHLHCFMTA